MNKYIIDGNNLIGKISSLQFPQLKKNDAGRSGLVVILNGFFANKKIRVSLHFDGFPNLPILFTKGKIIYSEKRSSDDLIREEIDQSKNPRLITLISSDHSLIDYARVNSCSIIRAEDFAREIKRMQFKDEESIKVQQLERDKDTFMKLFNRK